MGFATLLIAAVVAQDDAAAADGAGGDPINQCKAHADCKDEKANQCLVAKGPKDPTKPDGEKVTLSFCVSKEDGEKMITKIKEEAKKNNVEVEVGWAGASKLGFAVATLLAAAYL